MVVGLSIPVAHSVCVYAIEQKEMSRFLAPTPLYDESGEWEDVVDKKFEVYDDDNIAKAIVAKMRSDKNLSMECKVLIVMAFRNAYLQKKKHVKNKLFTKKRGSDEVIGARIFEQWGYEAKTQLENHPRRNADATKNWFDNTTAYYLLVECIKFMADCDLIDSQEKLDLLNEQYGLAWNDPEYPYLKEVSDLSLKCL